MKSKYLVSCAFAAIIVGWGAAATAAELPADNAATSAATTSTDDNSTGVQEVIVSAQRRDESVQDVPMTIQSMTGDTLSKLNVTDLGSVLKYLPNVNFGNNGPGQGNIFMRGLSAGFAGNQSSATVGNFPNVAVYLDDQSMQFPARNVDIYMADMQRIEILEGPQGTLFGGGAEAGAVRYITNKPKLDEFLGYAEANYGITASGAPNSSANVMLNVPIVKDKLAMRVVVYDDRQGGYIDNVPSTFTRANTDLGNAYFNIHAVGGVCPNGLPPGATGLCTLPGAPGANNFQLAQKDQNPVTRTGGRISLAYKVNDDWDLLITQSVSNLDAEGLSVEYPIGSDFQTLKPLQVTSFSPSYDHDRYENTAWTVNGKIGSLKAVYTGGYMRRNIAQQMEYTNYSRTGGGMYYQCTGGGHGLLGGGPATCYSPVGYWQDTVRNTHLSNEFRVSTPDDWRWRAIGGVFAEDFKIYDIQNFNYKTIPSCTPANLTVALGGGAPCLADVRTAPNSTTNDPSIRSDNTAFGEDTQRGYKQFAAFASTDYDIIPKVLTVTLGTRYYRYNEFEVGSQYGTGSGCLNVPNGQCTGGLVNIDAANDHKVYTGFKSRGNLTWHATPDTMFYYTFSQGFRPGGFNRSVSAVAKDANGVAQFEKPNGYAPDNLTNNEVGYKTELLEHRLQLNLSAYDMKWKNVQLLFFNPTQLGNTTFGVNGPDYTVKGAEAQVVARVTHGLTVQGSASYNEAKQSNSPCLVNNIASTAGFGKCITEVNGQPFQNPFGAVGTVPAFSPKFQGNIRAHYDWDLTENYRASVMVGANYMGSMYNQPATYLSGDNVTIPTTTYLRYLQPSYTTADASVRITTDKYFMELYATNLGNSRASTFTSSAQFIKSEVPIRPRVIMLKIGANF